MMGGWKFEDDFPQIEERLERGLQKAVTKTAKRVLSKARRGAPKDTGALAKSGAVVAPGEDGRADAANAARDARPEVNIVTEAVATNTPGHSSAEIVFQTDYALPVHNGHMSKGKFVGARPFLTDALHNSEDILVEEATRALDDALWDAK